MAASPSRPPERLCLRLRHRRPIARSEITQVALSHSSALAVYASTQQTSQSWADTFALPSLSSLSKTSGSHGLFSPADGGSRVATLRDWTVQLGGGVEYHHASSVLIRDVRSGKSVIEIKGAAGTPLAWSRDGRWIAASEAGGERIGVWEARTGARIGRAVSHIDRITHTGFTPDGRLVTLSRDGTLRITNQVTSKTQARLEIDSHNPRALAVSPDGQTIVSIWGSTVHIWHPELGDLTSYGLGQARVVEGWPLCISPDCRYLASRTEDGFDLMELSSGAVVSERTSDALVTAAAFSPDSSVLLLGRMDGVLEAWDVEEKKH